MANAVIFQSIDDGFWYFWDESHSHQIGPYATEQEAVLAWKIYCNQELG